MKPDCRNIERLLYLYREGELSAGDRAAVADHTRTCARCRAILEHLVSIDDTLRAGREEVPVLQGGNALVEKAMARISGLEVSAAQEARGRPLEMFILRRLRPALASAVIVGALLFAFEQSRDVIRIDELEARLQNAGSGARPFAGLPSQIDPSAALPMLKRAGVMADPAELLRSGLFDFLRRKEGLFDELARKYPGLSTVVLEDGIDERERKILETEGRAFLKEFDTLLHEGGQKP